MYLWASSKTPNLLKALPWYVASENPAASLRIGREPRPFRCIHLADHDDQPAWTNQILESLVVIDIFAGEQQNASGPALSGDRTDPSYRCLFAGIKSQVIPSPS